MREIVAREEESRARRRSESRHFEEKLLASGTASDADETVWIHLEVEGLELPQEPQYILWDEAATMISDGRIRSVYQRHDLVINLFGYEGQHYKTLAPRIDEALRLVEEYGRGVIMYATE